MKELVSMPSTKITTRHLSSAPRIPPTKTPAAVGAPDLSCVELLSVIGEYLWGVKRVDAGLWGSICSGFSELPIFADGEFEKKCVKGSGGASEGEDNGGCRLGNWV
jgi:hypothetical protein